MEECGDICQQSDFVAPSTGIDPESLRGAPKRIRKGESITTNDRLINYLWQYVPVPIEKASTKVSWLQDPYLRSINESKQIYKDALSLFERQIQILSIQQIYQELEKATPLFGALHDTNDHYETREDSITKLEYFLSYQLNDELDDFMDFLFNLLNKTSGKFNCLNIIGAPSSGKTYFARLIKEAMITSGQILNMSRNNNFPFNNCVGKRLLHWDEPAFDPSALEEIKLIFSGDELPANIKFQNVTTITRTPVIVTANMNVFPNETAFHIRIKHFRFRTMSDLKDWKYLHPMCLYDLFIRRGYIENMYEQEQNMEIIE